ncbi:alpha/beta hydrolase [Cellvibrio sp. OA-2007]|uniref:alpha/beta hydrolase n=1 Tax=Cellvibrio sp. OA-2007 TaxID=529823 RepID=UPI001931052F|nr:alpha/beta hydrolase [Cellvibrio sp. OA-2007]
MSDSRSISVGFDTATRDLLLAQLPDLLFDLERDSDWCASPPAQAYLNFYGINFAKTMPNVIQGFGALKTHGFRIASHYWLPANPKGTLIVVHGYYDHMGIFGNAIQFGLENGLAVLAFDLPGHGLSSGEQVAIDSFNQYADVLDALLLAAQKLLPAPYFAVGQSTGGSVLLNYLWRYDALRTEPLLTHIALCAPLILPRGWRYSGRLLYALVHRFIKRLPRGRSHSSHDERFNRFVDAQDCLQSPTLSVRWVSAMKEWDKQFRQFPPLSQPVLVVQGDEDMTVTWRYNLRQIQRVLPNAQIAMVPGAGHQLVNETDELRAPVFGAISRHFFGK